MIQIDDDAAVGQALRLAREQAGWSQTELARRVGMDRSLLSRREAGLIPTPARVIREIAAATNRVIAVSSAGWSVIEPTPPTIAPNPARDLPLDPPADRPFRIPLLGTASAGPGSWQDDGPHDTVSLAAAWLTRLDGAVRVHGDSMSPLLRDGDIVGVRLGEDFEIGDVVVAIASYGECVIKVYAGQTDGVLSLTSANPRYPGAIGTPEELNIQGVAYGLLRPQRLRVPT